MSSGRFSLYQYEPSVTAPIVLTALFAATTGLHTFQLFRTRTWFFIAFLCGGLCEVAGYAARVYSANQNPRYTLSPYIVQQVLLLVAPALFAASIYMELGKIADLVKGHDLLILSRRWITRTFVAGDLICFLMQGAGASLMANLDEKTRDTGANIVVGGLFVQIVFFGGFVITSILFHRRASKHPESEGLPYSRHLIALYAGSLLIFARSSVRAAEFLQGFAGPIFNNEAYLFGFDAAPMFLCMIVFNWVHPSEINALLKGGKAVRGLKVVSVNPVHLAENSESEKA